MAIRPNPRDGRSKLIEITPAGRAFRAAAVSALSGEMARLATRFPAAKARAILPVLAELRAILDAARGD